MGKRQENRPLQDHQLDDIKAFIARDLLTKRNQNKLHGHAQFKVHFQGTPKESLVKMHLSGIPDKFGQAEVPKHSL